MKIRKIDLPKSKYSIKCPFAMTPQFVVMHNTDNIATAEEEVAYMHRNDLEVSFHYVVDDKEVIQCLPLDRNAWHAGDGFYGNGNRAGIAIEICYSYCKNEATWKKKYKSKFEKAEVNASKLVAKILHERKWGIDRVKRHMDFDGKNCPRRTNELGWTRFLNMVQAELDKLNKPVSKPATTKKPASVGLKYKVGDTVKINYIYLSSTSKIKLKPLNKQGKITKVIAGKANPYLLDNGMGWVNDKVITGKVGATSTTKKPATSSKPKKLAVGMKATPIKAISYDGVKLVSSVTKKAYKVIQINGKRVVLGDGLNTAFNIDNLKY